MEKNFSTRIKHKRDTSANWTSKNPVILYGEIILVDTADGELRAKIGDGTKTYTQLPFTDEALRSLIANTYVTKEELEEAIASLNVGFAASEADMAVKLTDLQTEVADVATTLSEI